ncbi:MAG: rhomboid family intramembrane serine protease [Rhizobiaceae bacterium]|nr:rhomboid family intramembrane serine protease [Rhizobiaceae bacterium]
MQDRKPPPLRHEPAVNVPGVVLAVVGVFVVVQIFRVHIVSPQDDGFILAFGGFIPLRYVPGSGSEIWPMLTTPVTHTVLHGSWPHLVVNSLWLVVFGSPLARRIGPVRFLMFFSLTAAAGAAFFAALNLHAVGPLIGASGAVSGITAAAARYGFSAGVDGYRQRRMTIGETLSHAPALGFILVWIVINAASSLFPSGSGARIAWEAHVGGFLAGFLLLSLFDRRN